MRQPELWLMLVALFLYFFDATLLLQRDQAMVTRAAKGWRLRFGMREWTIAGKEPLLPNPLTGHRPAYLVRWDMFNAPDAAPCLHPLKQELVFDSSSIAVMVSTFCLFILLPLGLFTRAGSVLTVLSAILITLNNLIALLILFKRRARYSIDMRAWITLTSECLLCPPFSLNLVRKVCALQKVDERLELIAERLLAQEEGEKMRDACLARIDDALLSLGEDAPEEHALRQTRQRFESNSGRL